jgi:hypothetical protein
MKQVILNNQGNSFLGFHTSDKKFTSQIDSILEFSKVCDYSNSAWIFDEDYICKAAGGLKGVMQYMKPGRILVHFQKTFI